MPVNGQDAQPLRVEVLGQVRAWRGGRQLALGPPLRQAVLAVLALRANRMVPRDDIVDAVWGEEPPASAINGVHVHVAALRRAIEPDRARRALGGVLTSTGTGYQLTLHPDDVDINAFCAHLDRAQRFVAAGQLSDAVDAFDAASTLWRATPLAGMRSPWADGQRVQWGELRLTATLDRAEALLGLGRHTGLIAELSAVEHEHPLLEKPRALLMVALCRTGRQADALTVFAKTRRLLVDELGIEPSPALHRLHHDILNNAPHLADPSNGVDDATEPSEQLKPRQLPPDVRAFTGRADELAQLDALLPEMGERATAVVISALAGTAGVGKTALAVYWAHQATGRFPDGQLYVNLRGFDPTGSVMDPAEAVRRFLDALNVPPQRIPAELDAQAALYRSQLAGRRMLIVLDNARDSAQVRPLLPGAPGCLVLVTSRNQLTSLVAADGARPITLDLPTEEEARQLLARRLGADRVAAEPQAATEIVIRCARLPLAMALVAAGAALRPRAALHLLADELRDTQQRWETLTGDEPTTDVRTVFSWSYQPLTPEAARLFRLLGLHPGPDIAAPAAASLAGIPAAAARPLLAELTRASLLVEHTGGRYTFHDLLRAYATDLTHHTDTDQRRHAAIHRMLDHYLHTAHTAGAQLYPTRDPITLNPPRRGVTPHRTTDHQQALAWFTAEHAVLLAAVDHAAANRFDTHAWQLAWILASYLERRGHWHDWAATGRVAVAAAARLADQPGLARAHRSLGFAYTRLYRFDEADSQLQHALDLYRHVGDRIGEAHTHQIMLTVEERRLCYRKALDHGREALDLYRAAGHRHGQAQALNNIGWCHGGLGEFAEALTFCGQALPLLQDLGNRDGQANTWDSLGYAYHHLGEYAQAIACYGNAVDLYRDLGDRYYEADTLSHVGDSQHAAGDPHAARQAWQQALVILTDLAHPDAEHVRAKLLVLTESGCR